VDRHKIKEIRKSMGLTQAQFAIKIGHTKQTICRWERGVTKIGTPGIMLIEKLIDENERDLK